jgi:hypothetical protein
MSLPRRQVLKAPRSESASQCVQEHQVALTWLLPGPLLASHLGFPDLGLHCRARDLDTPAGAPGSMKVLHHNKDN